MGYEKMVPSVPAASRALGGASHIDISMGADPGLYCLSSADILTEVDAIKQMFRCEAKVVCAGGIGGNEGAHYWAVDGEEADVKALVEFLERISRVSFRLGETRATAPTAATPAASTTAKNCLHG